MALLYCTYSNNCLFPFNKHSIVDLMNNHTIPSGEKEFDFEMMSEDECDEIFTINSKNSPSYFTNPFSRILSFSDSNHFSQTSLFSDSNHFSQTSLFSDSNHFSQTLLFGQSRLFSQTSLFSDSFKRSIAEITNIFSLSKSFTKTDSLMSLVSSNKKPKNYDFSFNTKDAQSIESNNQNYLKMSTQLFMVSFNHTNLIINETRDKKCLSL
ncbi:hypothetical protein M9Y10_011201 [Tritrichomonas musculus]|uniref:Uncharacterized protein n=1 Tax=Tritrichomonas musculus TaxID=1915356 RepID=A0ABR2IIU1_9EUKA